ncbi:ATP-binding response regulator [Phaeobacter marinintestinus]|uniref:ATP-binding response regulator n=1 Tax=Falsiphaeobacter marinintestinus TaxID=1492905 RepID=UPI0011B46AFE|nr:ATP-binding protein [Phaeobacter marinintestinus]
MSGQIDPILPNLNVTAPPVARVAAVLVLAFALVLAALLAVPEEGIVMRALLAAAATLVLVSGFVMVRIRIARRGQDLARDLLAAFIDKDASPSFVTDGDGAILKRNAAARKRFSDSEFDSLAGTLRAVLANPSAALYRLQCKARVDGAAREDVVTRRGHVRLAVHQLPDDVLLWRVEDVVERAAAGRGPDHLPLPMITVGRSGAVLFMNDAARTLAGGRKKSLDQLFSKLPLRSGQANTLSGCDGPTDVLLLECEGSAGRRELYFMPVQGPQALEQSQISDAVPIPILKISTGGALIAANRLAQDLLGPSAQTGTPLAELMQGLGRPVADWLRATAEGQAAPKSEFLRLTRKDKEVFVQVTLSRALDDGTPILIAVLTDATELKTLEAQFVQSQKMQAIGQLAGGVAHDFNNLLTAISGHCDLLLLRHDQGDQDYGDLIQINQNANRAAALVGQLLAFSRKQTLRPEVLDLRDTLSDLAHLLNRLVGEKVTLTLSHDPVLRPIRADKRQLEQVLMNLVVNARDAMPGGGEIRIATEVANLADPLSRDRATVPAGDYITVKVSDEGIGIEPDALQKVFEPFYTTKRTGEGTGLGLSTAYGIIKQSGGYIFVDSVPGTGTQFTLYFPVNEREQEAVAPRPERAPVSLPKHGEGVVLLVEDEAPVRAFASRALRLRGYTVLEAESAEDALTMLDDPDLTVDVFVTDVVMPGMDGPSWVRKALVARPGARVVFVSGYAEGAFGESEPGIPDSVFLPKPFSLNQLTETVHQQLH